ncbi:MAG: Fe-S protein assembly co-chaperone HscB [Gammaproteobacteria bacterium]|nr:Fe-S protein assembly co-chaperone HscB [Gammaproteobacteria bacterium]
MDFRQNYFQLFDLNESFEIDLDVLAEHYRQLQRVLHPDRFASAPDQERRLSLQQAAHVNAAFQTLKDPLQRAQYLLQLRGLDLSQGRGTINDLEFLEAQIELREALAEIRAAADPHGSLVRFNAEISGRVSECLAALGEAFAATDAAALERAGHWAQRLQFYRRLQQEAEMLADELM